MLGYATDGVIANNTATRAAISTLTKGTTDCQVTGNTCREFSNSAVYYKGALRSRSRGNNVYVDSTGGVALKLESDGAGVNTDDSFYQNNNVQLSGTIPTLYLQTEASQVCTIVANTYYDNGGVITNIASISGDPSSPYTSFGDFRAAGFDVQAQDLTGTIRINSGSSSGGLVGGLISGLTN